MYVSFLKPYTFYNGATVKKRIMLVPMKNFASADNGEVTEEELEYYRERSQRVGTVVMAVANVTPGGKRFPS